MSSPALTCSISPPWLLPLMHLSGSLSSGSLCSHISGSLHLFSHSPPALSLDMPPCGSPALFSRNRQVRPYPPHTTSPFQDLPLGVDNINHSGLGWH